jgi:hypothetical protein
MARLLIALLVVFGVLSAATASMVPPKGGSVLDTGLLARTKALPPSVVRQATGRGEREEFLLTEDSEVLLDGRACKYKEVPANVSIIRLEVGPDNRTILKVHFRTRK